jgi:hypothetical protein
MDCQCPSSGVEGRSVMSRRTLVAVAAAAAVTLLMVASASALPVQGKVGPNQVFGGLVNGQGGASAPAVIRMACFGPLRPGQTGHPLAGQTVEVFRPEAIVGHFGNTGPNGTSIVAFFGPPPPEPQATTSPTPVSAGTVTFKRYGVVKAIPKSLVLPCSGTGHVFFVPMPFTPPMSGSIPTPAVVPVSYVGQP